jgi:hypothetical protein
MISRRQNLDYLNTVAALFFLPLLISINLAATHILSRIQVKESYIAVCKCTQHVRFELMHRHGRALLLWHDEVHHVFEIVHAPDLDDTVLA